MPTIIAVSAMSAESGDDALANEMAAALQHMGVRTLLCDFTPSTVPVESPLVSVDASGLRLVAHPSLRGALFEPDSDALEAHAVLLENEEELDLVVVRAPVGGGGESLATLMASDVALIVITPHKAVLQSAFGVIKTLLLLKYEGEIRLLPYRFGSEGAVEKGVKAVAGPTKEKLGLTLTPLPSIPEVSAGGYASSEPDDDDRNGLSVALDAVADDLVSHLDWDKERKVSDYCRAVSDIFSGAPLQALLAREEEVQARREIAKNAVAAPSDVSNLPQGLLAEMMERNIAAFERLADVMGEIGQGGRGLPVRAPKPQTDRGDDPLAPLMPANGSLEIAVSYLTFEDLAKQ